MRVLLITGAPGAGKTSVLGALTALLEADDIPYAAVEVESLALVHPWPDTDAAFAHLQFIAESFRQRGYPTLLVTATIESAEYLARLRRALAADELVFARLEAPVDVLRDRVTQREPADWVGLPALLNRIESLAKAIAAVPGIDLVLETEGADPAKVARTLLDAAGGA